MKADRESEAHDFFGPLILVLMSVVGVGLGYSLSIVQARRLGAAAFQDYAVVVASMGLLCAVAEAGAGKFALKVIPEYATSGRWSLASGYWRFSVCFALIASVLLAGCVLISEGIEDGEFGDYPLAVAVLFLPAAAICGIGIDFVMANRAAVRGTLIAQLLLPATTFLIVVVVQLKVSDYTTVTALLCYGTGSVLGAVYCVIAFLWTSPRQQLATGPSYQRRAWLPQCLYFASISFLASWTLRISLLVLELLPIPEVEVAVFAAAMETGCLILMLSKSTDKMFQPQMSAILAKQDWRSGRRLRRNRYWLMGGGCSLFMGGVLTFGTDLLGLYGPEFTVGYPALCFVAFGACMTATFSLAPAFLKFSGHNGFVVRIAICGAFSMAALTGSLGLRYGANGAGFAVGLVLTIVALIFLRQANRQLFVRKAKSAGSLS